MNLTFRDCRFDIRISIRGPICPAPVPSPVPEAPIVLGVDFDPGDPDMPRIGHIRLDPAPPDVTSRPCDVVVNGGAPTTVDMFDANATITANDGETVVVTARNVTAAGSSPPSAPFTSVVPPAGPGPGGGGGVPPAPTILGVDWDAGPTAP